MKALSVIFLLLAAAFAGCSKAPSARARPGTLARMEKRFPKELKARNPASQPSGQCFKDRSQASEALQEISRLEQASAQGSPVSGTWNGKSLRSYPAPMAQFLDRNQWLLYTAGVDVRGCTGVPCLYNRIYGVPDESMTGWYAYGWYLRTGLALSAADFLPSWPGTKEGMGFRIQFEGNAARDYLFSDRELKSFWELSHLLPEPYLKMRRWQSIHRAPWGAKDPLGPGVCGLAVSQWNKPSFILLETGCLNDPELYVPYNQHLYVTHELSHALDWEIGISSSNGQFVRLSESADWRKLSGWNLETVTIPKPDSPNERVTQDRWVASNKSEGFVRDYAGTNPGEDYAETSAHFRFNAEQTLQISPRKSEFLSKQVFGGRKYDHVGLFKFYEDSAFTEVVAELSTAIQACVADSAAGREPAANSNARNKRPGPRSAAPTPTPTPTQRLEIDASLRVEPLVAGCVDSRVNGLLTNAFNRLRFEEWEACEFFKGSEAEMRSRLLARLGPEASRWIAEQMRLEELNKALQQLRASLGAQVDPREAYLHCYRQKSPRECYQSVLNEAFEQLVQPLAPTLGDSVALERNKYFNENPYERSAARVREFHQQVFGGAQTLATQVAAQRWENCMDQYRAPATAETILVTQPFSGGDRYTDAGILACLNNSVSEDLKSVYERYIAQFNIPAGDPDAQSYVMDFLLPEVLKTWADLLAKAAEEEDLQRFRRKPGVVDVLLNRLVSDTSWVQQGSEQKPNPKEAKTRCMVRALKLFTEYFSTVDVEKQLPSRFEAVENTRYQWSDDACKRALESPVVGKLISHSWWNSVLDALSEPSGGNPAPQGQIPSESLQELEAQALTLGRKRALDCKAAPRSLFDSFREAIGVSCLNDAWPQIERIALDRWSQSVVGAPYAGRREEAVRHLSARRDDLQAQCRKAVE